MITAVIVTVVALASLTADQFAKYKISNLSTQTSRGLLSSK